MTDQTAGMSSGIDKPFRIGLVLSGGSARGFAHLGVLRALEEYGIIPDVISAVSAGAIVGVFYADGYCPGEIFDMFVEKKLFQLIRLNVNRKGFLKPSGIEELMNTFLRAKTFPDLKIPLYITASDMNRGKPVYFHDGDLRKCILASSAIPILFQPVMINNTMFLDGGLLDNLPVHPVLGRCRLIIGVSVNPNFEDYSLNRYLKLMERTFYLSLVSKIREHSRYCDIFIEPEEMKKFGLFEIKKAREMVDAGYKEARQILKKYTGLLASVKNG